GFGHGIAAGRDPRPSGKLLRGDVAGDLGAVRRGPDILQLEDPRAIGVAGLPLGRAGLDPCLGRPPRLGIPAPAPHDKPPTKLAAYGRVPRFIPPRPGPKTLV